jgi:hypothetical protein
VDYFAINSRSTAGALISRSHQLLRVILLLS